MRNIVIRLYLKGWRLVIANCPVKVKKNRNEMSGWKRKRLRGYLLRRSGDTCEQCGRHLEWKEAEIHHILPVSMAPELAQEKSNLMCLCHQCHVSLHSNPIAYTRQIVGYYPEMASKLTCR